MIQAHKIRLNPTPNQQQYFMQAAGTARYAYNWAVAQWRQADGQKPNALTLKKQFNAIKPDWAYAVTKCAAESAFFDFAAALRNWREGRAGEPQFKRRSRGDFSFYVANDKFDVSGHWLKVPKLGLVNMAEKLRFRGKILGATISKEADWWYVSITVQLPDVQRQPKPNACGIDVGINHLATLSDGTVFDNPRPLKHGLARLAALQRRLEQKEKFLIVEEDGRERIVNSGKREKAQRKIGRLHQHIRNIRDDILHKLTRTVAEQYGFVAVEDLNVVGMTQNHCLAQALQDAALGRLLKLLESKVEAAGGRVVQVDRFYPSSKTCCQCGWKHADLTLADRVFVCGNPACRLELDRDLNASINILQEGWRLAEQQSLSGSGYDGHKSPPKTGYNLDETGDEAGSRYAL